MPSYQDFEGNKMVSWRQSPVLEYFSPILTILIVLISLIRGTHCIDGEGCYTAIYQNEPWRDVNLNSGDTTDRCDKDTFSPMQWYTFQIGNQSAMIPITCVQSQRCGAKIGMRIDLDGKSMPEEGENITAYLCGSYNVLGLYDCCVLRTLVTIAKCKSNIYVYRFHSPIDRCPAAVCTHKIDENVPPGVSVKAGDSHPDDQLADSSFQSWTEDIEMPLDSFMIQEDEPVSDNNTMTDVRNESTFGNTSSIQSDQDTEILNPYYSSRSNEQRPVDHVINVGNDSTISSIDTAQLNWTTTPRTTFSSLDLNKNLSSSVSHPENNVTTTISSATKQTTGTVTVDQTATAESSKSTTQAITATTTTTTADNKNDTLSPTTTLRTTTRAFSNDSSIVISLATENSTTPSTLPSTPQSSISTSPSPNTTRSTSSPNMTTSRSVHFSSSTQSPHSDPIVQPITPSLSTTSTNSSTSSSISTASRQSSPGSPSSSPLTESPPTVIVPPTITNIQRPGIHEVMMIEMVRLVFVGAYRDAKFSETVVRYVSIFLNGEVFRQKDEDPSLDLWYEINMGYPVVEARNETTHLDLRISHSWSEEMLRLFEREDLSNFMYEVGNLTLIATCRPSKKCLVKTDQTVTSTSPKTSSTIEENMPVLIAVTSICAFCLVVMTAGIICAKCRRRRSWQASKKLDKSLPLKDSRPYCEGTPSPFTDHQIMRDEEAPDGSITGSAVDGGDTNQNNSWVVPLEDIELDADGDRNNEEIVAETTEDTKF